MSTDKPAGPFYKLSVDETLTSTNSSSEGISSAEAASRLQQYGENALPKSRASPHGSVSRPFQRCPDLRPAGGRAADCGDGALGRYHGDSGRRGD